MATPEDSLTRKLTAILLVDVVGYSRLMEKDELDTLSRLKEHRQQLINPSIEAHHGRIVKLMGDGALVEFASVVEAVACAHEIQTGMLKRNRNVPEGKQIEVRIGINLGDVIVEGKDIHGDGVNIAARLEAMASPGGICISGMVFDALGNKLPLSYEALGEQTVKNIANPVRVYRAHIQPGTNDIQPDTVNKKKTGNRLTAMIITVIVLAITISLLVYFKNYATTQEVKPSTAPTILQTDRPSIAVLPFSNLSGETEQEYFSDGITNDIITDLSQLSNLLVIASNSVFVYKNLPVKVQQVATELGVSHVLEGSVQKSGQRVRINAQLIDATSGHHLWAERFDRDLVDIFSLQDEVSKKIVSALAIELTSDEQRRLDNSSEADPEAYDLLLKGLEKFRRFTGDNNIEAQNYFLRAIEIDPDFARAYADVALSYAIGIQFGWLEPTPELFTLALEYGNKALALDDTIGQVHFALSMIYLVNKQHDKAIEASERSVSLNPNYADGYAQWALALSYAGKPDEVLIKLPIATKINPKPAFFYTWIEGHAHMLLGHEEQAERLFLEVIDRNAQFQAAHLTLAALYGNQGRIEDAQWEAAEVLSLQPDFSLSEEAANIPYKNKEHLDYYINGLRNAGLPD
jgi:adenylate cyclase